MDILELLVGNDTPHVPAPKWLAGMAIRPVLLDGHLWWDCPPVMLVKGGPPIGVVFAHSRPRILPDGFGPHGRGVQVRPAEKDVSGILTLRDQLGETRARCFWRHFKLANRMFDERVHWFAYPTPDPDQDDKPPLVGMVRHEEPPPDWDGRSDPPLIDTFAPVAFVTQVAISLRNFFSQEEIDRLPAFAGLDLSHTEHGDERHE